VERLVPARRLPLELAAAAAGLIGGHVVSYLLTAPAAPVRRLLLTETGHSYFPRAVAIAVALTAVAGVGAIFRGATRGRRASGDPLTFQATFQRLAAAQSIGFVILEVLERKAAGATLAGLGGLLPRGLVIQVLVAAFAATALWLLDRAGASLTHALRGYHPASAEDTAASLPVVVRVARPTPVALGAISLRGPPLPSHA
jgi:hypothetical protein